ncbi:MAG: 16S rRNA (cytosine(967)-C(5))-methyltransferase RsmB [Ruminococcaceae bacterium]|nr:16S rRNA (cytosine(967)-C(5))-methyltransferase RsmB [Oscillospiraceae bacterium]
MKDARRTAFEVLYTVFSDGAYSNLALDKALDKIDIKDKSFASALVYGVIERKLTLDYLISQHLKTKAKPKVRIILYLGTYQLYFSDKVPSSAAINTSVNLAADTGLGSYKGLINAVLHKIDDNRIDLESLDDLCVRYSCPEHLINMWKKMYGVDKTIEILSSLNGKPPVFAVPNKLYTDAEELQYELLNSGIDCEVAGELVRIKSAFDLRSCKPFNDGLFHIEDLSCVECANALGVSEGDTVLDICSAPGGKAFTIAESMHNSGTVYAFDLYEHRVKLIENGATRLGITNIKASVSDGSVFNQQIPEADKILCDVPCSGFGIIRRKPEIRYKELDSIKELPELQYAILQTSSGYLRTGGIIVYSTCTLNKRENERVTERFLNDNNNFKLIYEKTIFPSADGGDGFYYAVMERTND